nr:hypothetical protein GCM10020092_001440 [Actinoplanes digitatis]
MASWSEFAAAEPELASAVRALLQQYGPGMGYLATVRADGGPRVHPVSPVVTEEGLYCFVVDSAKRRDLERDGRYALHSYPPEESDDEAYVAGRAHPVTDRAVIARLARRPARLAHGRLAALRVRHRDGDGPPARTRRRPAAGDDPTPPTNHPNVARPGGELRLAAGRSRQIVGTGRTPRSASAGRCQAWRELGRAESGRCLPTWRLRHGTPSSGTVVPLAGVVQWQNISFPS